MCDAFEGWFYDVDIVSPHEKDAPEAHSIAKDNLAIVLDNKNEGGQMINIDMRKNAEAKKPLKSELCKRTIVSGMLLETFVEW